MSSRLFPNVFNTFFNVMHSDAPLPEDLDFYKRNKTPKPENNSHYLMTALNWNRGQAFSGSHIIFKFCSLPNHEIKGHLCLEAVSVIH